MFTHIVVLLWFMGQGLRLETVVVGNADCVDAGRTALERSHLIEPDMQPPIAVSIKCVVLYST